MLTWLYSRLVEPSDALVFLIASSHLVMVLLATFISFFAWRLWAFTLSPMLHRNAPKPLPYWIPILGHARAFITNAQALIEYGSEYFGDTSEPFAVTVGGRTLYILTSSEDVGTVYKNNATLSWDAMLNDLLIGFGVHSKVIPQLWTKLPIEVTQKGRGEMTHSTTNSLSAVHSTLDLYKRQLLPGPKFETINRTLLGYISRSMTQDMARSMQTGVATEGVCSISLNSFCSTILVDAVTRTLFGDGIYEIEPDMTQCLLDFNYDAWMLVFQYPQAANSKMIKARQKILSAFSRYIQGPLSQRTGQSWIIETVLEEQKHLNIDDEDRAALLLMIYWAANINPYRLGFWMLSYILFDASLCESLRAETSPAYKDGEIDVGYLMTRCPRLYSTYQETLRVTNGALSARKIIAPTKIGEKILDVGGTIIIPFRHLHYNKKVFGTQPAHFDPNRFLKDKSLNNSGSFRPFGGGINYCPGRFLAKQEMLAFVGLALHRFDITLSRKGSQNFPELDITTPALGVNGPQKGANVLIDL